MPRKAVAAVCAVLFLLGAAGYPLAERVASTRVAERYPCERHACGCTSAERCWRTCCCKTLSQKLAWAREQGVTPPDYVLAQLTDQQRAGITQETNSACPVCAASKSSPAETTRAWVLGIQAEKCRGQASHWIALGAVSPPPTSFALFADVRPAETLCQRDISWSNHTPQPDVPVPRAATCSA